MEDKMSYEEAVERMKDLIDTCDKGVELHPYDKDLFLKDKRAIEIVLSELQILDKENKWFMENSIPKSKIEKMIEYVKQNPNNPQQNVKVCQIDAGIITALETLLQDAE